jgi:hypothetical protein
MRRSSHPTEILLGFAAGMTAALFVQQPLVWFLHHFGLTAREAFSTVRTPPLGVEAVWSRVFWGGAFGIAIAYLGVFYPLGARFIVVPAAAVVALRTVFDWFVVPMLNGHAWIGWSVDRILTPLLVNACWGLATAVLLAAMTVLIGTYGERSLFD